MVANTKPLLADASFIVALFNPTDSLHEAAAGLVSVIADYSVVITNLLFAEIVTILSLRYSRSLANDVGDYLLDSDLVQLVSIDQLMQAEAWELFQKCDSKNISFTDCSSIILMKHEGIDRVLTFDLTDFKKLQLHHRFQIITQLDQLTVPSNI